MFSVGSSRLLIIAALTFFKNYQSIYVYNSIMRGGLTWLHFRHKRNSCQNITADFTCPFEDAWLFWVEQRQGVRHVFQSTEVNI